ncbi:MAG: hypothetical protein VR69_15285 [Peptococcaceae bacterium BRH_c4b]|nr:MAG: hypothetical protein VR69_15285 [Peptococcaceae bacterium BRH_c4b]
MPVLDKARELGEEISSSQELLRMRDTQNAMLASPEASNLVGEFNDKQKKYMALRSQGIELNESQQKDVEDLEKRMLDNPLIVDFFRAQQEFERMLEGINNIISSAISGESSSCAGGACSDDCCSSCSGC